MTIITIKQTRKTIKIKQDEGHLIDLLKEHSDLFEIKTNESSLSEGAKELERLGETYEIQC